VSRKRVGEGDGKGCLSPAIDALESAALLILKVGGDLVELSLAQYDSCCGTEYIL